jgi:hypothetical protein
MPKRLKSFLVLALLCASYGALWNLGGVPALERTLAVFGGVVTLVAVIDLALRSAGLKK